MSSLVSSRTVLLIHVNTYTIFSEINVSIYGHQSNEAETFFILKSGKASICDPQIKVQRLQRTKCIRAYFS